jgi:cytochrome oxidase Cu insertion factor (SCO1/SenC/PrrC family)
MLKKTVTALLVAFLLLTLLPGCSSSDGSLKYGNRVGDLASDFTLEDLSGDTLTLSSLLGQPVALNFWSTT